MALGDASVEIIPDVSKFEGLLTKAVNGALKGAVVEVEKAGDKISAEFVTAAKDADRALSTIDGDKFTEVRKQADKAGDQIGESLKDGAKKGDDAMRDLAKSAGFAAAGAAIAAFAKSSVDAFADMGETLSKAEVIFGDATDQIVRFGEDAATALGQSKQAAISAASEFAIFGKAAGLGGQELATFSTDLTTLASDLASFSNTTPEDAVLALGAALRGESEPIRRYGVLLDDATLKNRAMEMGIYDGNGALSQQQRVLAAQEEIFAQTTLAQGDFARTSDSLANSQKTLTAQVKDLQVEIGAALAPAMATAVSIGSDLVGLFQALPKGVQSTLAVVVIAGGAFVTAAKAIENFGVSAGKANKALGAIGIVLTAATAIYGAYNGRKQAAIQITDNFRTALEAEADGQEDATAATIARIIADEDAFDIRSKLAITEADIAAAIRGETTPAMQALRSSMEEVLDMNVGLDRKTTILKDTMGITAQEAINFLGTIDRQATGFAEAEAQIAEYDAALRNSDVTTRIAKAELRDFNLAVSGSTQFIRDKTAATEEDTAALQEAIDKAWEFINAQLALINEQFAAAAATDRAIAAVESYSTTTDDATTAVNEQLAAQRDAEQAILNSAVAAMEAAKANGQFSDDVEGAAQAQQFLVDQLAFVAGTLDENSPLRRAIEGHILKLSEIDEDINTQVKFNETGLGVIEARLSRIFGANRPSGTAPVLSSPTGIGLANGGIFDSAQVRLIGEAGREAVIPITRPARALQLMERSGLADLARGGSGAAVNIQNATFVGRSDADLVAQKVAAATRTRIFAS